MYNHKYTNVNTRSCSCNKIKDKHQYLRMYFMILSNHPLHSTLKYQILAIFPSHPQFIVFFQF